MMYEHLTHIPITTEELDELVSRTREGDTIALKYLVVNNIPLMLKLLRKYGADKYDMMHECVPCLMRYIPEYNKGKGAFSSWVGLIVRSRMGHLREKRGSKKRGDEQTKKAFEVYMEVFKRNLSNPRSLAMWKEYKAVRKKAITEALAQLSIRHRYLVTQYYMKGRTLYDIADEEQTSQQNIQQILTTARRHMEEAIEPYKADLR